MHSRFTLTHTAYLAEQIPKISKPQILLAGRSNSGKSSLINSLSGHKNLARTSSAPGKTRSINFFHVHPEDFYLVDLPGYGYAKCSKKERNKWPHLIGEYLHLTRDINGVVLILDSRVPPQALDMDLAEFVQEMGLNLLLVLTKTDKCTQKQRDKSLKNWRRILPEAPDPLVFSAQTGRGREKLWEGILHLAGQSPPEKNLSGT